MHRLAALALFALSAVAAERPNIIVIMADDLGYSDLGCYGGEIDTPNLDRLAENGLRFTNFSNASRCCPTRASLMTGLYPHQTGLGRMTHDTGKPGYRGELAAHTPTIAEMLRAAGYSTGMVGKWHLSLTPDSPMNALWVSHLLDLGPFSRVQTYPVNRGFDEHLGTIWGVVDFFDPFSLVHNERPIPSVPEGFYYTDWLNDRAAEMVEKLGRRNEPFFLYVAHTAPHWPLQALPEDIEKYKDRYKIGWDEIRKERYQRMVDNGLLDAETARLSARADAGPAWKDNPTQEFDARAMAVHAAMVDRLDQGLSRITSALESIGEMDDTLIVFLSDNGASPEEPQHYLPGFDRPSHTRDGNRIGYTTRKRRMPGAQNTYAGIGPMWANAANTPFRYWKKEQYEGGSATPLIVHWPAGMQLEAGSITGQPGHVVDLVATAMDVGRARVPETFAGRRTIPLEGRSLRPVFEGDTLDPSRPIFYEHFGARAMRQGDWKIVALSGKPWELYNLAQDRTETTDLASREPERVQEMAASWEAWADRAQVNPMP